MQTSSISRICSSSWPSKLAELVSMSGKRRRMFWAVMGSAKVVVVDIVIRQRARLLCMYWKCLIQVLLSLADWIDWPERGCCFFCVPYFAHIKTKSSLGSGEGGVLDSHPVDTAHPCNRTWKLYQKYNGIEEHKYYSNNLTMGKSKPRNRVKNRNNPTAKPVKPPADPELAAIREKKLLPLLQDLQSA